MIIQGLHIRYILKQSLNLVVSFQNSRFWFTNCTNSATHIEQITHIMTHIIINVKHSLAKPERTGQSVVARNIQITERGDFSICCFLPTLICLLSMF